MAKEIERVGIPTAMISAIYGLALTTGANRVVKGVRIEHVIGDPALGPEKDYALGMRIVQTALKALQSPVEGPTLFDPQQESLKEASHAA